MSAHGRNALELPVEEAPAEIRRQRFPDWNEGERVTETDALDVHRAKVCRDCGRRIGHKHLNSCPQREAT